MRWASETSRKSAPSPSKLQGRPSLDDGEARLVVAVEELIRDPATGVLVGELQGLGAEPLDIDDRHGCVGQDAANGGVGSQVFELGHALRSSWWEQTGPRRQTAPMFGPSWLSPSPTRVAGA